MKTIWLILLYFCIVLSVSAQESDSSKPKETIKSKALIIHQQSPPEPEQKKCPEKDFWGMESAWDLLIPSIVVFLTFIGTKYLSNTSAKEREAALITNIYETALDTIESLDKELSDTRGIVEGVQEFENQTADVKSKLRNRVKSVVNRLNRIADRANNDQDLFNLYFTKPDGLHVYLLKSYEIFQDAGELLDINDFDIRPLENFKDKIDEQSG